MSGFAHVDDIVILSTSYREMHSLLETVNRRATAMHMRIYTSKTKAMSAFIPGESHLAVLLTGELLEDVEKFKYLGSMLAANGRGSEEIISRINPARSAFSRLQSYR